MEKQSRQFGVFAASSCDSCRRWLIRDHSAAAPVDRQDANHSDHCRVLFWVGGAESKVSRSTSAARAITTTSLSLAPARPVKRRGFPGVLVAALFENCRAVIHMRFRLRTLLILMAAGLLLAGGWLLWRWEFRELVEMNIVKLILMRPSSP